MAFDVLKWLTEDLGYTADEAKELAPRFADRAEKIEKGYLRQSDYSKNMNDLQKNQEKLTAAEAKLNEQIAEWATLSESEKANAGELRKQLDESQERVFKLTQRATRLAEDAGVDPKTIIGDEPPPAPKKPEVVEPFDPKPLYTQIGGVADYMLTLNAELPAIAQEHFDLTGQRLDTRAFIASIKEDLKSGKKTVEDLDPVRRWESKYKIPELRQAKATEKYNNEIKAAEERGRTAAMTESALPNTHPKTGTHAPIFRTSNVETGSKLQRPQPSTRMAGAVAALASHKYAPQNTNKGTT